MTEGILSPTATGAMAVRWRLRDLREGASCLVTSLEMQCMSEVGLLDIYKGGQMQKFTNHSEDILVTINSF